MGEFVHAEYAIGGFQNRNQIFQKRDFTLDGIRNDCFRSLFLFDEGLHSMVDVSVTTGTPAGPAGTGIDLNASHNNTLQNVTGVDRQTAILLSGTSGGNTVTCSSMLNNTYGIQINGSGTGNAVNDSHIGTTLRP